MIKHNKPMLKGMGVQYEKNTDAKKMILIFNGTVPTATQLQTIYDTNGVLTLADLMALGTIRVALLYSDALRVIAASDVTWPLTGAEVSRQVLSEGPVSFFVFCYAALDAAWPALDNAAVIYKAFVGTAGPSGEMVVPSDIDDAQRYSVSPFVTAVE
jgi:hypothetical protein